MRRLVLPALLALLPGAAAALDLKPALGITFSDFSKDPQSGQAKGKVGWQLGATVLLGETLYLEGGAFYARRSIDITAAPVSGPVDVSAIEGFRIPAMVGTHLLGGAKAPLAIRIFAGGSAFVVTKVNATGLTKSDFESPAYGVFAGAGVNFLFLFADLTYEWQLTDATKLRTVDVGAGRSLFLNAGIRL